MDEQSEKTGAGFACPMPISAYQHILLAHGGGGKLTQQMIQEMLLPQFHNSALAMLHDGALLSVDARRIAFTTDSYVVNPIFFPGGDIGKLAVNGTVNDLAMCGARPLYLSLSFILEEGLPMGEFQDIVRSIGDAAKRADVTVVTGDTKVVEKGKADKMFINTSGIGFVPDGVEISPQRAGVGDKVILSGTIGDHGIAIMAKREGIEFRTELESDTAPLHELVSLMLNETKDIHVLRDPTRGGVASSLNEIAGAAGVGIRIYEEDIPVRDEVRGACEILGFDPLYVANEGKLIAVVPSDRSEKLLQLLRSNTLASQAQIIGEVVDDHRGRVVMRTVAGGNRIVDMLSGEQLPRIC